MSQVEYCIDTNSKYAATYTIPTTDREHQEKVLATLMEIDPEKYKDYSVMTVVEWTAKQYKRLLKPVVRISEETYNHMLEVLPPVQWEGDRFCMSEFDALDVTGQLHCINGVYMYKPVRFNHRESYISLDDYEIAKNLPVARWLAYEGEYS